MPSGYDPTTNAVSGVVRTGGSVARLLGRRGGRCPDRRRSPRAAEGDVEGPPPGGRVRGAVRGGHGAPVHESAEYGEAAGRVRVRGVLPAALLVRREVRQRHGLAELLPESARSRRDEARLQAAATHRVPLRPLQRTPGSRVRRRPPADGPALLQQRRRAPLRSRGRDASAAADRRMTAPLLALVVLLFAPAGNAAPEAATLPGQAAAVFAGGCFWCMEGP